MSYASADCSCNFGFIPDVVQCRGCNGTSNGDPINTQRIIQKQVRAPASMWTMNLGALSVVGPSRGSKNNNPKQIYSNVNWNQSSDRAIPGLMVSIVPSRGNSTKRTLTANRPGAGAPGGLGVDIKHNSYDRYLARKKAFNLRTGVGANTPLKGNKTKNYGMLQNTLCDCPPIE